MKPHYYGQYRWCVKTKLSKSGDIYLNADRVEFPSTGAVIFWTDPSARRDDDGEFSQTTLQVLTLAPGQWTAVYAASGMDGHAVAVDHWEGEVNDDRP